MFSKKNSSNCLQCAHLSAISPKSFFFTSISVKFSVFFTSGLFVYLVYCLVDKSRYPAISAFFIKFYLAFLITPHMNNLLISMPIISDTLAILSILHFSDKNFLQSAWLFVEGNTIISDKVISKLHSIRIMDDNWSI